MSQSELAKARREENLRIGELYLDLARKKKVLTEEGALLLLRKRPCDFAGSVRRGHMTYLPERIQLVVFFDEAIAAGVRLNTSMC